MEYIDILKKAMDKEIESRDIYVRLVKSSLDTHSQKALEQLASEEQKHFDIIKAFSEAVPEKRKHISIDDSKEAEKVWKEYRKKTEKIRSKIFPYSDELTILEDAIEMEKEAMDFYTREKESVKDPELKRLLHSLAQAEQRHFDYVSELFEKASPFYEEFPETRPQL